MPEQLEELVIPVRLETSRLQRDMQQVRGMARSVAGALSSAFADAIVSGRRFSDVLRGLIAQLAKIALKAALKPIFSAITSAIFPSAAGNVFSSGRVRAFAQGGVVGGPTVFPMRGGLGLMGEAGPEAIMPLKRGPDGKLGVAAHGTGAPQVNVTMHISTPDAESFRRNRGAIAAELARAVAAGRRNL